MMVSAFTAGVPARTRAPAIRYETLPIRRLTRAKKRSWCMASPPCNFVFARPQGLEPIMPQNRGQRSPSVLLTLVLLAAAPPARAAPTTVAEIATYMGPDRQQMLE